MGNDGEFDGDRVELLSGVFRDGPGFGKRIAGELCLDRLGAQHRSKLCRYVVGSQNVF